MGANPAFSGSLTVESRVRVFFSMELPEHAKKVYAVFTQKILRYDIIYMTEGS